MTHPAPPSEPQIPAPDGDANPSAPSGQAAGEAAPDQVAEQKSGAKKAIGIAGAVAVAGAVGIGSWLVGPSAPEVGDCVTSAGEGSFDVVDCGGEDAEARVVGVEPEQVTEPEFQADDSLCAGFAAAEMVLWVGDIGQDGTVLCAEPV